MDTTTSHAASAAADLLKAQADQDDEQQFYTTTELANLLRVSHAYAHSLIATKEIRAINFGKGSHRAMWRIPREEVERWVSSRQTNASLPDPEAPELQENKVRELI
jgi:excisionase family DNA binding protein